MFIVLSGRQWTSLDLSSNPSLSAILIRSRLLERRSWLRLTLTRAVLLVRQQHAPASDDLFHEVHHMAGGNVAAHDPDDRWAGSSR